MVRCFCLIKFFYHTLVIYCWFSNSTSYVENCWNRTERFIIMFIYKVIKFVMVWSCCFYYHFPHFLLKSEVNVTSELSVYQWHCYIILIVTIYKGGFLLYGTERCNIGPNYCSNQVAVTFTLTEGTSTVDVSRTCTPDRAVVVS